MNTNRPLKDLMGARLIGAISRAIILFAISLNAYATITDLATEPITQSAAFRAKPNILFVLDDSGSMQFNYLPDWAGPADPVTNPPYLFNNSDYNGVAYNPATRYYPPVMYTSTGALDSTTYPSQTGLTTATGADSTTKPNWKAVKDDGYGVQAAPTVTSNLEGNAFSYTTIVGEYCDSAQLRNCTASAVPTGAYTFPAKLRWCNTLTESTDPTLGSNTFCQAANIADTQTNIDNGVTPYTFPRVPSPRTSTITVNASGTVTSITVGGLQILSASATGASTSVLATDIVSKVNACSSALTGSCAVVGFVATSASNVVTLTATSATTATPAVTGVSATSTAFSGGSVPGSVLLTVITPGVTSYVYPGTAAKAANRSDCASTTCTYEEEMTNYANWWTYYHTRMQMMKTGTSIAFAPVTDNFRVGYSSINNGTGSDFLNLEAFDGTQKYAWYTKFFNATPFGTTPDRLGLANAGRLYAGKFTTFNNVSVTDPMQYSCQQNYTILSTDGYWNDPTNPKQVDGSTDIGQQDGSEDRPYYDGASQSRTVTQTLWSQQQLGINTFLVESRTSQLQSTTSRLTQSVTSTDTYPYTKQVTTLQTRTTPLNKSTNNLESRTYSLTANTQQLQKNTFQIASTVRILESYTRQLQQVTTPLQDKQFNITKVSTPLQDKQFNITSVSTPLQDKQFNITKVSTPLQDKQFNITSVTTPLQDKQFNITSSTTTLQSSTYKLQSSTRQLQQRSQVSTNGGDSYNTTSWSNVSSCTTTGATPVSGPPGTLTRNTQCRYDTPVVAGNLSTCSTAAESPSSPYTVAQAVTCAYETTPTVANVGTCTVVAQSGSNPYLPSVTCAYSAPVVSTNDTACTAIAASTGPTSYTVGTARTCTHNGTAVSTTDVTSCTAVTPANAATPKHTCGYTGTPVTLTNEVACTVVAQSAGPTTYSGPARTCTHNGTAASTTNVSSCTAVTPANAATPKHTCGYTGTPVTLTNEVACTVVAASPGPTSYTVGTSVSCTHNGTAASTTNVSSCTAVTPANAATPKHTCGYTGTPVTLTNEVACTVVAGSPGPTSYTVGTSVSCTHNGTAASTTNVSSCTAVTPSPAATPKHTCGYTGTPVTLTNEVACTVVAASPGPTSYTVGTSVSCTHNGTAASTTNVTSCTAGTPSPAATPKHTCTYTGTPVTVNNLTTCTAVAQSPGPTNYTGPAVACTYQTPVTATNLTTCTAGTASAGPVFSSYQTCGYINGAVTSNLNSCVVIADSPGPTNYTGPGRSCAYQGTPTTLSNQSTCTAVAQSGTFAAPSVTCTYATAVPTTVTTCTVAAQSPGPTNYIGPAIGCAYSGTASATNLNASTCNANRQTTSPYTGPAVDCVYNGTPVVTNNVTTCTVQAQSPGPTTYTGPAVSCAYGSPTAYVDATAACTPVAQSGGATKVGPARDCAYTSPSVDTFAGTCTNVPANNTNLVAVTCVPGAFPVVGAPVVTTVDTCSTAPTSSGSPIVTSTATTCTYQTPATTVDAASCTASGAAGSPVSTTLVTCGSVPGSYIASDSCTPAGLPPSTYDGTGKIVECRTTDIIATSASPNPVATCTPLGLAIDPTSHVQTQCSQLINVPPTPIDTATCVATTAAAPSFISTICDTTTTTTHLSGCTSQTPSSPLWQTVTCADDGNGTTNTLADTAEYYFKTDLRTSAFNNCTGSPVPPATTGNALCSTTAGQYNNVPTSGVDNNPAQHMVTFTLGLGASGYMQYKADYLSGGAADYTAVKGVAPYTATDGINANPSTGVCSWQTSGVCNWPTPVSNEQTGIDDLWHAGVNGRGAYFSTTDPNSLSAGISSALATVAAAGGSASASAVSNPNLAAGENYIFSSTFTTNSWDGELIRRQLNTVTGAVSSSVDWGAQAKLDAKTASSRNIYTFDAGAANKLKAFTAANFGTDSNFTAPHISTSPTGLTQFLCASPTVCLSPAGQTAAAGNNLVDYLRGVRTNEGAANDNNKYYRQRQHVLGDIVDAAAVFVSKPRLKYSDAGYAAYLTAQASRRPVVYGAANDGMLHAFAATGSATAEAAAIAAAADPTDAGKAAAAATAAAADVVAGLDGGQELWAYIPSMAMPNLYKLADKDYANNHRYFVDGTPVTSDICVSLCGTASASWKTILVGGLNRGGRGYYALDITNPASPAALWEFTDATNANLGYSYGNPRITKLSDGTWVVLVTSGYNNVTNADGAGGDGEGHLFVLNAATGALIRSIDTAAGGTGVPSGLNQLALNVVNPTSDNTATAAYAGDLDGKLWRFDINNNLGASGYDAQLLAVLQDTSGNLQPITTKPEVGVIDGFAVIFVGTGKFLASSDATDTSAQTVYAIKDPLTGVTGAIYTNPGGSPRLTGTSAQGFVRQILSFETCPTNSVALGLCASGETVLTATNNAVDFSSNNGWFVDLIQTGERVNVNPALALGIFDVNTNAPDSVACSVGGKSYAYFFNYLTGGPIYAPGNGDVALNNGVIGTKIGDALASSPTLVMTDNGDLISISVTSDNVIHENPPPLPPGASVTRRTSWRELIRE